MDEPPKQPESSSHQGQIVEPIAGADCPRETRTDVSFTSSRPKSLLGNAVWSVALTIWLAGVTFFLTPFLIARIGTDHYGLFILLMSISGMMGLMNLGLGEATLRFVAYYYGRNDMAGINRVVGATFSVYLVSGLVGWAVLFFGASPIAGLLSLPPADHELAVSLLRLTAITFGIGFITGAFTSIPQAMQRYDVSTKISIAQSIFQVVGTVAILLHGGGIYQLVLWSVATMIFTQALCVVVAKRLLPTLRMRPSPTRAGLKEVFGYGLFSLISSVMGMIWSKADSVLLGLWVAPTAVAQLAVPQQLSFRGGTAIAGLGSALFPRFSAITDLDQKRRLYLASTWTMMAISAAVFTPFTVLLPDFLRLWINPEFAKQAAWVGQLIAFSCIIRGAFEPHFALFKGAGKPQYLSVVFVGSGLTSLAANLILIPLFGLAGAGYCYLVTLGWGIGAMIFTCKSVLVMPSLRPLLRIAVLPTVISLLCLGSFWLIRHHIPDFGWGSLILLYAIGLLSVGALIFGAEWLLGRRDSYSWSLMKAMLRFFPF